jgi:type IV pilus assembly protein PilA
MKFLQKIRKGKKGFTLIELLVVIAILGVIAAVAVPNVVKFIGSGTAEAQNAEKHNVTVALTALMVDAKVSTVTGQDVDKTHDLTIGSFKLGDYLTGGIGSLAYTWTISNTGGVTLK